MDQRGVEIGQFGAADKADGGGVAAGEQFFRRQRGRDGHDGLVTAFKDGLYRLKHLRPLTLAAAQNAQGVQAQAKILRKMLLALAADIRVVLVRLASRTQTLRWFTDQDTPERADMARESLQIYAPLANRLGVWQIKWEIEDLAFRFIEPATYKRIAKQTSTRSAWNARPSSSTPSRASRKS